METYALIINISIIATWFAAYSRMIQWGSPLREIGVLLPREEEQLGVS